jgi:FdhD protein
VAKLPRTMAVTLVSEWQAGDVRRFQDYLAGEEPLQVRVNGMPLTVTMRTPGTEDLELAAGWLFTEGIVQHRSEVQSIGYATDIKPTEQGNIVDVQLQPDVPLDTEGITRNFAATSGCGICGKGSIDTIRSRRLGRPNPAFRIDPQVLWNLPARLQEAQTVFGRTGGLHAAGLFTPEGELVVLREDIGRHNAVDKVVGWAMMQGSLPLSNYVLLVSGRGGFEIIQKAIVAGIPVLASVSAPSSLAVQLARELGLTLIGFLRGERCVVYSGEERLRPDFVRAQAAT